MACKASRTWADTIDVIEMGPSPGSRARRHGPALCWFGFLFCFFHQIFVVESEISNRVNRFEEFCEEIPARRVVVVGCNFRDEIGADRVELNMERKRERKEEIIDEIEIRNRFISASLSN